MVAGSRQVDALSCLLCAPVLGQRNEADVQVRRPHLLPAEGVGRWQRSAELGHTGANRGAFGRACRGSQERSRIESEFRSALEFHKGFRPAPFFHRASGKNSLDRNSGEDQVALGRGADLPTELTDAPLWKEWRTRMPP